MSEAPSFTVFSGGRPSNLGVKLPPHKFGGVWADRVYVGGSLVGVWNGWGCGIAIFRALNFQISEPLAKVALSAEFQGFFLENAASEKYFSDSGEWPFHTPPIHTPTKCRPIMICQLTPWEISGLSCRIPYQSHHSPNASPSFSEQHFSSPISASSHPLPATPLLALEVPRVRLTLSAHTPKFRGGGSFTPKFRGRPPENTVKQGVSGAKWHPLNLGGMGLRGSISGVKSEQIRKRPGDALRVNSEFPGFVRLEILKPWKTKRILSPD